MVSFLYFANMMHWRLVEPASKKAQSPAATRYKTSLEDADFLLPDGIALQWFAQRHT